MALLVIMEYQRLLSTKEWLEQTLPCISIYEKELVTMVMDPSLIVDEDLLELGRGMGHGNRGKVMP